MSHRLFFVMLCCCYTISILHFSFYYFLIAWIFGTIVVCATKKSFIVWVGRIVWHALMMSYGVLLFSSIISFSYRGCRQHGQEIVIATTGRLEIPQTGKPHLVTSHGTFLVQGYIRLPKPGHTYTMTFNGLATCYTQSSIKPFSQDARYRSQGIIGEIKKLYTYTLHPHAVGLFARTRIRLYSGLYQYADNTPMQGLLAGLVLGDTTYMTKQTYTEFLNSGLVHVVSASGGNIVILVTLLGYILYVVPLKYKRWISIVAVVVYAFLLGENISFLRACISCIISIVFVPAGYYKNRYAILLVVLCIIEILYPLSIVASWGLVLSVAGVYGLLHTPTYKNRLLSIVAPTVGASFALQGPLLVLVGKTNLLSLVLSLATGPLVSIILFFYVFSWFPGGMWLLSRALSVLYQLASRGSKYGLYIVTDNNLVVLGYSIRICSRIILPIYYHHHRTQILLARD